MGAEELPEKIEALVDHLRGKRDETFSLADVASVTEVLIGTMRTYFRSIDTNIYRECRTLSDYIGNARKEIAALQPKDLETDRIPRAGMELDAIVQQTEEATNTIMSSAEAIMGADPSDVEGFQETVQENIMQIFEACSFQDITGQRISKVVQTLTYVETRIHELRNLLGITDDDVSQAAEDGYPEGDDRSLLRGPALAGEGIDQDAVDALMGSAKPAPAKPAVVAPPPAPPAPQATEAPEAKAAPKPQSPKPKAEAAKPAAKAPPKPAAKAAEKPAEKAPPKAPEKAAETSGASAPVSSSQDEIDALFN
ncbi:chemotaxis regulator CheZ [alpha proteobacterium Q-1]|nr:chemotaxis regulator CheZ [alpha proteobacterium Q-1]